jgi:hypothetical protein
MMASQQEKPAISTSAPIKDGEPDRSPVGTYALAGACIGTAAGYIGLEIVQGGRQATYTLYIREYSVAGAIFLVLWALTSAAWAQYVSKTRGGGRGVAKIARVLLFLITVHISALLIPWLVPGWPTVAAMGLGGGAGLLAGLLFGWWESCLVTPPKGP